MKIIVTLCAIVAVSSCYSITHLAPTYGISPFIHRNGIFQDKTFFEPAIAHGITTQYHTELGSGHVAYGHSQPHQSHTAVQDGAGNKVGSFSYVKPDGSIEKTNYIADAMGYRVTSSHHPVAHAVGHVPEAFPFAHLQRFRRDVIVPASTTPIFHHTVPIHSALGHAAFHNPLHHEAIHVPLAHSHHLSLLKRNAPVMHPGSPTPPDHTRYPQLNPNPQKHLYTNTNAGQEYASHYHTDKN